MPIRESLSLARRLHAGESVYSAWCSLPYPIVAEVVARARFAAAVIDQQHGLWDSAAVITTIAALRHAGAGAAAVVRIPVANFSTASRALDFGAEGIIAPMINSTADARALVAATKYPPLGERSWGPHRALMLAEEKNPQNYLHDANALTLTFAMIESAAALDNVGAIAAIAGIDVLFVGPWDLSIALSNGAEANPHAEAVKQALGRVATAAAKAGKVAGLYCGNAE